MILQKNWLALLVIKCLCLSLTLYAQQTPPQSKLSPWVIGMELAGDINTGDDRNVQDFDDNFTYGRVGLNGGCRIMRWLAIEGQLQFHRQTFNRQEIYNDNVTGEEYVSYLSEKKNLFSFSIGPKFMYRVGQGDLSFSLNYGGAVNFSSLSVLGFDRKVAAISYQPKLLTIQQIELGYTYWPTRQLGISAKVSLQNTGGRGNLAPNRITGSIQDSPSLELFHPELDRLDLKIPFGLGFHYRFKK